MLQGVWDSEKTLRDIGQKKKLEDNSKRQLKLNYSFIKFWKGIFTTRFWTFTTTVTTLTKNYGTLLSLLSGSFRSC